jgi:hypothetical protein
VLKKTWAKAAIGLIVLFGGAQFVQPEIPVPVAPKGVSVFTDPDMDPRVLVLLQRACGDCHSNETRWPWYVRISPGSWFMVNHVKAGRKHLNFSTLPSLEDSDRGDVADTVRDSAMPLPSYLWLHPEARLSSAERQLIQDWANGKLGPAR